MKLPSPEFLKMDICFSFSHARMPCFRYPLGGSYFYGEPTAAENQECGRSQEMWTRPTRSPSSGQVRNDTHSPTFPSPLTHTLPLSGFYSGPTPLRYQCRKFFDPQQKESTKTTRKLDSCQLSLYCKYIYLFSWMVTLNHHIYLVIKLSLFCWVSSTV